MRQRAAMHSALANVRDVASEANGFVLRESSACPESYQQVIVKAQGFPRLHASLRLLYNPPLVRKVRIECLNNWAG